MTTITPSPVTRPPVSVVSLALITSSAAPSPVRLAATVKKKLNRRPSRARPHAGVGGGGTSCGWSRCRRTRDVPTAM